MTLQERLQSLKEKPEHVRKRIAFGGAVGLTALVAFMWAVSAVATGSFALGNSPSSSPSPAASTYGLAGAAAALPPTSNTPAHIEVVNQGTAPAADANTAAAEQTVIPF